MKRIKCVSIDIDGTLVREGGYYAKEITVDNITEIKEFCNKGGKIILATGRDLIETNKVFEHLCNNGISRESIPYLVCLNGSVIQNTLEEKNVVFRTFFNEDICRNVCDFLERRSFDFFLFDRKNNCYFRNTLFSWIVYLSSFRKKFKRVLFRKDINFEFIQKIVVIRKFPDVNGLKKQIYELFGNHCYCSCGPKFFLEIIDKRINKFYALEEISRLLNIDISEFSAIGNEQNDILSLENVGFGVGVDLKKKEGMINWDDSKIDFHVLNEDGNGVARAFREMKLRNLFN